MKALILTTVVWLALGSWNCGAAERTTMQLTPPPLPPRGVKVVSPDPSFAPGIKAFSGVWEGVWDDKGHGVQAKLVVEEIMSSKNVKLLYSWGGCALCNETPGWRGFTGEIVEKNGKDVLFFGNSPELPFTFTLKENQLIGTMGEARIAMEKCQ
jgi:hypothetical protein